MNFLKFWSPESGFIGGIIFVIIHFIIFYNIGMCLFDGDKLYSYFFFAPITLVSSWICCFIYFIKE